MKPINKISTVTIVLLFTFFVSSCKKYEEGPALSFLTKTERLTSSLWELDYIDGEIPEYYMTLKFETDGEVELSGTIHGYTEAIDGTWRWAEGKESIRVEFGNDFTEWDIMRLSYDDFWFEDEDDKYFKFMKK
ncbi:MAG: hypothetical protein K8R68_01355 [Bacteroidales bacterium]|nr:hypothetical protein [Bacteroidales bacterium]